jgi:DNA polymerase-3 subunit alpha
MQPKFIHLRLHSEYSLVDGLVKVKPLVDALADLKMPAVAMTDQSNFFSLIKFYRASLGKGIKPIAGSDIYLLNPDNLANPFCLTLLVKNNAGYRALTELISKAYQEGQHQGVPMIKREWIENNHAGLIALSGAIEGDIGQALLTDDSEKAKKLARYWQSIFPDSFYLELQRIGKPQEESYLVRAVELATQLDLPVVATNNVRFLKPENFAAHEIRVCINQGRVIDDNRRPKNYTEQQYLRSVEEMQALFDDIPEALENTVEIAKRCNISLKLGENFLPDFPVPKGMSLDEFFIDESKKGLNTRLQKYPAIGSGTPAENRKAYDKRLDMELGIIIQMGFPGYFMIVADFIQWAKDKLIPVGPGRGSGAGSLVAYVLNITDLDPIEFDLLFERFLNPERVSMPDFDVDFCMDRRDEVIDYVAKNYGRDKVSQIITYGSMAAKAVIRDVGRVLSHPYGFVDRLSKLVPFEMGMTLTKALEAVPEFQELYDTDEEVKALMDMALSLEGTIRNAGKHAGGVVIAPTKLTDFSALYCEQGGGNLVTQFDKDDVEAVGLVKFDFLGLRTLTIINWALQTINKKQAELGDPLIDITQIPRDDKASYDLLMAAQTTAVFQLESRGMKELIKKLKPDCFNDIIALVALFRPGPLESGMVDDYIDVKHGAKAEYAHPSLKSVLEPTNGVILYQEQVMQIAREMGGYTLGGADLLRRAMGKKKVEEMAQQRALFTRGAVDNGIEESIATHVFDLMEKFAGYGFNKSHSAAYALVAYQTAWLKAHYPPAFMAAVMSSDMDNTDKVVILVNECSTMKIKVCPPNINISHYQFTVNEASEIVYGIGAIKGVGEAAIDDLLVERKVNGEFKGLYDLCKRIDLRKVNKRVFEALIHGGAFDVFNENRASHMAELPIAIKVAERHIKMLEVGQNDLFGLAVNAEDSVDEVHDYAHEVIAWSEKERLSFEKLALGVFLTGHPLDQYQYELKHIVHGKIIDVVAKVEKTRGKINVRLAGLLVEMRTRIDRKGQMMGFATLDDKSSRLDVAIYSETFETYKEIIKSDEILVVEGSARIDGYTGNLSVSAEKIYNMEQARENFARALVIYWDDSQVSNNMIDFQDKLQVILQPFSGGMCRVVVHYKTSSEKASIQLGDAWRVKPTDELISQLQRLVENDDAISIKYR